MSDDIDAIRKTYGRVRFRPSPPGAVGITLGRTEYVMEPDEALALANRIILTCVDKEERYAE